MRNIKFVCCKVAVLCITGVISIPINALEYSSGDLEIRLDNTIGYGIGVRTSERDRGTIMPGNGRVLNLETSGSSFNYDDGNLNYDKNDIYTNGFKLSSDLEINYGNFGGFFRAKSFYDYAIMDEETKFKPINDDGKDEAGRGFELLDAYIYANYDISGMPASTRIGRQVLSWGESTFIQGGINSINPVDASAFRKPGAEVKEVLLPVNMIYGSLGLSDDITAEAFYQLSWEKTRSDPCGTFFSTTDFVADGCGPVILGGDDSEQVYLSVREQEIENGIPLGDRRLNPVTERVDDATPEDKGQFGIALRMYTDINDGTEFGAYFMNIHSRLPYINGIVTNYSPADNVPPGFNRGDRVNPLPDKDSFRPLYQISYPEDLRIFGLSFSTSISSGASLAGEISFKPNFPVQWNAFELILAGSAAPQSRLYQRRLAESGGNVADLFGKLSKGYDEFDIWQAQTTWIKFVDQIFGADRLAMVAEVGVTYIPDLPHKNGANSARYGRSGAYGIGNNENVIAGNGTDFCSLELLTDGSENLTKNVNTNYCNDEGYVDEFSGGVRFRSAIDYNNFFRGITVTPKVSLAYDIGNGPEPGSQFIDNRLTTSVGLGFTYMNNTSLDVAYNSYSGGDYNVVKDRDNITLAAKYSF